MNRYVLLIAALLLMNIPVQAVTPAAGPQTGTYDPALSVQTFTRTVHGGVQHVVVKSAGDLEQARRIQAHLQAVMAQYRAGDFTYTERMHGRDMPGLARLKQAQPGEIRFQYQALDNGGQIHYSSEYPQYVQALHEWFAAQAGVHGNAVGGHDSHHGGTAE